MGWSSRTPLGRGTDKKIKKAAKNIVREVGDAAKKSVDYGSAAATLGAYSTDGKSGYTQGASFGAGVGKALGIDGVHMAQSAAADAMSGRRTDVNPLDTEGVMPVVEDEAMKEELENQKKRARMSTTLAGNTAGMEGFTSAKRTLLGI